MAQQQNILDVLLEGTDKDLLSKEQKEKISGLINETVEARVQAKEKLLAESFATKEKELKESIEAEKAKLAAETAENEKVLVEQAETFKKQLEETVLKQAAEYKTEVETKLADKASTYRKEIETLVFNEAKEYKTKQDALLVEEVKKFKEEMIERVSDYLEAKLQSAIPSEIMESASKLSVYQPLVNSIMESFSKNFIKLDDTSYALIKESRDTISKLESDLQSAKKEAIAIAKQKREVEKKVKIGAITEGLTDAQRSKAIKLLESVDVEELDAHFAKIRDIVLESEVKPVAKETPKATEKTTETKTVITEAKKEEPKVLPVQQKAIDAQMKKVIADGVPAEKAPKKVELTESDKKLNSWASKIQPTYAKG
jgi:hypothetical protein